MWRVTNSNGIVTGAVVAAERLPVRRKLAPASEEEKYKR